MKKLVFCLLLALLWVGCSREKPRAVILISLDTLRQDHLGCYGYSRDTSPNLDRFAREEAVVLEAAYAQAPYTLTSHMSIMTGLYPEAHQVIVPVTEQEGKQITTRLADDYQTLAESFQKAGFQTAAFTDGLLVDGMYGFDQGFATYHDEREDAPSRNGFRRYGADLKQWIRDHADQDFFLFIHTYDTHGPFVPPEPFRSQFTNQPPGRDLPGTSLAVANYLKYHTTLNLYQYENLQALVDRYDGCIAYADSEVGALFELMKELDLWEESLVLVTSDHGETLMENGFFTGHGLCSFESVIKVPALLKLPRAQHAGKRLARVVETVDYFPTLLSAMGIPLPYDINGQDLLKGLNQNQWRKNFAFGVAPGTGENHYLVLDGIKYIEAEAESEDYHLTHYLQPFAPPGAIRPWLFDEPTDLSYKYYDFEEDPLGLIELFYQGDRAYRLDSASKEWQVDRITDRALLTRYKETAYRIADASSEMAGHFLRDRTAPSVGLSQKDQEQLEALGYGGLVNPGPAQKSGRSTNENPLDLNLKPVPIDRKLLDQGDVVLWTLLRRLKNGEQEEDPAAVEAFLAEGRKWYEQFKKSHPEREAWVHWRLTVLEEGGRKLLDPEWLSPKLRRRK